jgi:hypothetical protein
MAIAIAVGHKKRVSLGHWRFNNTKHENKLNLSILSSRFPLLLLVCFVSFKSFHWFHFSNSIELKERIEINFFSCLFVFILLYCQRTNNIFLFKHTKSVVFCAINFIHSLDYYFSLALFSDLIINYWIGLSYISDSFD